VNDLLLAIGMSPREWPGRLHRFVADHGGARIRITALTEQDLDGEFDVLILDDLCPFLSPKLVGRLENDGRAVVGLVDPEYREEGTRILRRCGVDVILGMDVSLDELLGVSALAAGAADGFFDDTEREDILIVGVTGPEGSCGKTEVAIGIARALTTRFGPAVLLDLDLDRPSIAVRLGLRPHPNLRSAMLALREGRLGRDDMFQRVRRVDVLPGLYAGDDAPPPAARELSELLRSLSARAVVADLGSSTGVLGEFGAVALVGRADPVGIARLLAWLPKAAVPAERLHVMLNHAPGDPFARAEVIRELRAVADASTVTFLPTDPAVSDAAWESTVPTAGRVQRMLDRWAAAVQGRRDVGVR
jgi:MinD-like ATPase involved in chromosome partitioning or flagellar assembly